ncbi:hypothetical protein EON65_43555 [archaeon]|nr:MAG: hypothetical protein EON65_43555 [archaeon]
MHTNIHTYTYACTYIYNFPSPNPPYHLCHSNTDIMSALQKFQSETKELQKATYLAELSSASIDGLKNMMQVWYMDYSVWCIVYCEWQT